MPPSYNPYNEHLPCQLKMKSAQHFGTSILNGFSLNFNFRLARDTTYALWPWFHNRILTLMNTNMRKTLIRKCWTPIDFAFVLQWFYTGVQLFWNYLNKKHTYLLTHLQAESHLWSTLFSKYKHQREILALNFYKAKWIPDLFPWL